MNRIALNILSPVLCLIYFSCSGSGSHVDTKTSSPAYRYAPSKNFTNQMIATASKDIAVRLPNDWIEMVDEKNAPNIILWMVRSDYSASISFTPVIMDPVLYQSLARDGLKAVAQVSVSMKRDRAKDSLRIVTPIESFRLNKKEFFAYEYSFNHGKSLARVVVFDTGKQFVECDMLPAHDSTSVTQTRELFEVQQGVLASMVLK